MAPMMEGSGQARCAEHSLTATPGWCDVAHFTDGKTDSEPGSESDPLPQTPLPTACTSGGQGRGSKWGPAHHLPPLPHLGLSGQAGGVPGVGARRGPTCWLGGALTSEVAVTLHLACGPGMQRGSLGSDWTPSGPRPGSPSQPTGGGTVLGPSQLPRASGASLEGRPGPRPTPPLPGCQEPSSLSGSFPRGARERPWAGSQEAAFSSLPGMARLPGE